MKFLKNAGQMLLLVVFTACESSTAEKTVVAAGEQDSVLDKTITESSENIDLINTVYDLFVFAIDSDGKSLTMNSIARKLLVMLFMH